MEGEIFTGSICIRERESERDVDVQDKDKKKAILLTVCGPSMLQLLKSHLRPGTPENFNEMVNDLWS